MLLQSLQQGSLQHPFTSSPPLGPLSKVGVAAVVGVREVTRMNHLQCYPWCVFITRIFELEVLVSRQFCVWLQVDSLPQIKIHV